MPHTPEPWRYEDPGYSFGCAAHVYDETGRVLIATCHASGATWYAAVDNGRRIVAAVNACAGIPTAALEQGVVRNLLAACEAMIRVEEERVRRSRATDPYWNPKERPGSPPDLALYLEAVRLAREAVAKAKGGAPDGTA
nr:MAG: hypothetical protein DIU70_14895 [Bacillota bacterium]